MALMSHYICPNCGFEVITEDNYTVDTMYESKKQYFNAATKTVVLLDSKEEAPANLKPWKPSDGCPICGNTFIKGDDYLVD